MADCLIITGGDFCPPDIPIDHLFVIACDHGFDHAKKLKVKPDLFIGDFDSVCDEKVEDAQIPILRYPSHKDDSDTMLAIKYAIENGYERIYLSCALGGRWDHAFANIQGMAYAVKHGVPCEIIGEDHIRIFTGGEITIPRRENYSLSLFSLTDTCEHVSIRGALYPAEDITLTNAFPIGLSNGWADDAVTISMKQGLMLIAESRFRLSN